MFYEANRIDNLLKCDHCNQYFQKYDEPKILTCCSNTICMSCFNIIGNDKKVGTIFKCFICDTENEWETLRFPINQIAITLNSNEKKIFFNKYVLYEKTFIENLLKCENCKAMFNKYEEPRVLSCCSKTICAICIKLIEKNVQSRQSKCLLCQRDNEISNILIRNNLAFKLIAIQPIEIYGSEESKLFKMNLSDLENSTKKLTFEIQNGEYLIKEHCNEQRRLIQLSVEQRIQHIYSVSDGLLERINNYEQECIKRYESSNQFKQNINEFVKQIDKLIEQQNIYLNQLQTNDQEIMNLNKKIKEIKIEVEKENLNVQQVLFNDKLLEFKMKKTIETNLGHFELKRLSSNLTNLLSCSENIKLWDLETNECLKSFKGHSSHVTCVRPYNNNRIISCSDDYSIKVWDINSGKCLKTLLGHSSAVDCVEIIGDDQIASCSLDKTIRIWNLESGDCLKVLEGHMKSIWRIKLLPNDINQLLSVSSDQTIKLWDLSLGECIKTLIGHTNSILCIENLIENRVITGSTDKTIRIWCLSNADCLQTLEGHSRGVWCIQIVSNDQILSGSFDNTIKLWGLNANSCLMTLTGHSGCVNSIRIISTNRIASCSYDKSIKVWNIVSGECLQTIQAHAESVYFIEAF